MKKLTTLFKNLWNDESGQGTAEYILLLVAVVTLAFMFKDQIVTAVRDKLGEVSSGMGELKIDK